MKEWIVWAGDHQPRQLLFVRNRRIKRSKTVNSHYRQSVLHLAAMIPKSKHGNSPKERSLHLKWLLDYMMGGFAMFHGVTLLGCNRIWLRLAQRTNRAKSGNFVRLSRHLLHLLNKAQHSNGLKSKKLLFRVKMYRCGAANGVKSVIC